MLPLPPNASRDNVESEPIFAEELLADGSIRYHMNQKLRQRVEAAVAELARERQTILEPRRSRAIESEKR
jgi:hypothetical protein